MGDLVIKAPKSRAKNAQHVQFVKEGLEAVPQEVAEEQGFGPQRAVFATAGNNEIACFKPEKALYDTPEVEASDENREKVFTYYKQLANTIANYCPDAEMQENGRKVAYAFSETGNIFLMDYMSETAAIDDLVATLRTEPYLAALTGMNLQDAPDKIEAANQEFRTIYMDRAATDYERTVKASLKTLRPITDAAFDDMVKAIEALYMYNEMITKDETKRTALQKVIDDLNVLMLRLKKSISGSAAGTEEEIPEDPSTETPDEENPGTEPENPDGGDGGDEENPSGPGIPNP